MLNYIVSNSKKIDKYLSEKISNLVSETEKFLKIKKKSFFDISFVSKAKIRDLNKKYRNKDKYTDVISFAFNDVKSPKLPITLLGDIFICNDIAKKQSIKFGHSYNKEIIFLILHGLLHLLGYEHKEGDTMCHMFKVQDIILSRVGVI